MLSSCHSDSRCVGSCDVLNLGMYVKAENYLSLSNNQVCYWSLRLEFDQSSSETKINSSQLG